MKTTLPKTKKTKARRTAKAVGCNRRVRLMAASECTLDQLAKIGRDNWDYKNHWLITDGYSVTVCAQKSGEEPTQKISLPRGVFNRLIKQYTKPQRVSA